MPTKMDWIGLVINVVMLLVFGVFAVALKLFSTWGEAALWYMVFIIWLDRNKIKE